MPLSNGKFFMLNIGRNISKMFFTRSKIAFTLLILAFTYAAQARITVESSDTLRTGDVVLKRAGVSARRSGTLLSSQTLQQTEQISRSGLQKMACCTLAESFENSATTSTNYSDAITGAKQIQLLGLSGKYLSTTAENVPFLHGIASAFGWNYTPSSWLESIQISKGVGSVAGGYETVSGQINFEFQKPNSGQPLYFDLYSDHFIHSEVNSVLKNRINDNWHSALMLHTTHSLMPDKWTSLHDHNNDDFYDMPRVHNTNLYNRWLYVSNSGTLQSRFDLKFVHDRRSGGQMDGAHGMSHHLAENRYVSVIKNTNWQVTNKTGLQIGEDEAKSLGIITNFTRHLLNSTFGLKSLEANQSTFDSRFIFNSQFGISAHKYQIGFSYTYDKINNSYEDLLPKNITPRTKWDRVEHIPGVFAEYTCTALTNFTIMAGTRLDYNSKFGWLFTPRAHVKYNWHFLTARFSFGRGYRASNPLTEYIGHFASSKKIHIIDIPHLDMEKAWNTGANVMLSLPIWNRQKATVSLDYYHIFFQDRTIADIDRAPSTIFFYNSSHARTDTWQADLALPVNRHFSFYAAFRHSNQHINYTDGATRLTAEEPLIGRYKAIFNAQYLSNLKRWTIDATVQLNGRSRLPNLSGYSSSLRFGKSYPIIYTQVSRKFKAFEIYVGIENLLNYTQNEPIQSWQDPYSEAFDASSVWGPIVGRKGYLGLRCHLGQFM